MTMTEYIAGLRRVHACSDAIAWAQTQDSPQDAWDACVRGDWMLWLCGKLSGERGSEARKTLVLAACQCARLSLHHVPADEHRPEQAICAVLGDTSVTLEDVRDAAAYAAAYAAAAAAYAAAADSAAAARSSTLLKCADIVRQFYPSVPVIP